MFGHIDSSSVELFRTLTDLEELRRLACDAPTKLPAVLPVYVGGRPDLKVAAELAAKLYDRIAQPVAADIGFIIGEVSPIIKASEGLWKPLATNWEFLPADRPLPGLKQIRTFSDIDRIVVLAPFYRLTTVVVSALLRDVFESIEKSGPTIGFLSGRDSASILWHVVKQWCGIRPGIKDIGLFTDGEKIGNDPRFYGEDQIEENDIQEIILSRQWKRLFVRGHARDDNLNLGQYTICGRNATVKDENPAVLRPRCGYGHPCFKEESKLMPLNEIQAVQVILSGCNVGPLADYALYGKKYQLHLNGIDGPAKEIISVTNYVHASGSLENNLFFSLLENEDAATSFNKSLSQQSTVPTYWTFGMPGLSPHAIFPSEAPSIRLKNLIETLDILNALNQPGNGHSLNSQLNSLRREADACLSRNWLARKSEPDIKGRIWAISRDLDRKIMDCVLDDPDDAFVNLANVVLKRSAIAYGSFVQKPCDCGRPHQMENAVDHFSRDMYASTRLPFLCTMCQQCCDESYRFPQGVPLKARGEPNAQVGNVFNVEVSLGERLEGDTLVTLIFPNYVKKLLELEPRFHRIPLGINKAIFKVKISNEIVPQAYHFTAFSVKELAVSTYRQSFKVFPNILKLQGDYGEHN